LLLAAWPLNAKQSSAPAHASTIMHLVSVEQMYCSARNQANAFFKSAAESAHDPAVSKKLDSNRAHLTRVFAYLGPKFVLNLKIKGFGDTAAARELNQTAQHGFAALAAFEQDIDALIFAQVGGVLRPDTNQGVREAQDIMRHLNAVFAECAKRLIDETKYPLDALFREFERFVGLASDSAAERDRIYRPLIQGYFKVWQDKDFSALMTAPPKSKATSLAAIGRADLNAALDELFDSMESAPAKEESRLEPGPTFKRSILRLALVRDEKSGIAALYDRQLTTAQFEVQAGAIRRRVAMLSAELGKASGRQVEGLFEKLCVHRKDLPELEAEVRVSTRKP
jgi:hypothetical protein